jgi:hypothetical protein
MKSDFLQNRLQTDTGFPYSDQSENAKADHFKKWENKFNLDYLLFMMLPNIFRNI